MPRSVKVRIDGAIVLFDLDDALKYVGVPLYLNANGYIRGRGQRGQQRIYPHREIAGAREDQQVDHINGNRTDNRRENLRICSQSQNLMNSAIRSDNTSGTVGVHFCKTRLRWVAQITVKGRNHLLGRFQTETEAIEARKRGEEKYHGQYSAANGCRKK